MEETVTISNTARVWIYMADRPLSNDEVTSIQSASNQFAVQWAAHGKQLTAQVKVEYNRFVIFMVDEAQAGASGCSIDSSVHFVKELGQQYNIDFFNRLLAAYKDKNGVIQTIHQSKLKELFDAEEISNDTIVFNNMVANKSALDQEWEVTLKDSFYRRLVG